MDFQKVRIFVNPDNNRHVCEALSHLEPFFKQPTPNLYFDFFAEELPKEEILLICSMDNLFAMCELAKTKFVEFIKYNKILLVADYDVEILWNDAKIDLHDDFTYPNLYRMSDTPSKEANIVTVSRFIAFSDVEGAWLVDNKPKAGNFFCLMSNKREHRDILTQSLYDKNLLSKGKVVYHSCDLSLRPFLYQQSKFEDLENFNMPVTHSFHPSQISKDYLNFNLELIAESRTKFIFLSEKSIRAFTAGTPFLVVAAPEYLKYIQDLGFETFHKYIDESYDTELDLEKRIDKVTDILVRMESKDFVNVYSQTRDIAAHNLETLFRLRQKYNSEFIEKIYYWIKAL